MVLARPIAPAPVPASELKQVVVIGAGIVGLCSALWLLRIGHRVTIIDRMPPAPGQDFGSACSYVNATTIALHGCVPVATPGIAWRVPGLLLDPQGPLAICWQYLPRLMPWLVHFLRASTTGEVERIAGVLSQLLLLADACYAPLLEEAGATGLLRRNGCLYLYKTPQKFKAAQAEFDLRQRHQVSMDVLNEAQIRALEPRLAPLYYRGVLFKDAYTIDGPHQLVLQLAAAIRARGGEFVQGEAEHLIPGAGGVEVAVGEKRYRADRVVVAGGAWSKKLARQLGDKVLLDTERGYNVFFGEAKDVLSRPVCYPEHGFYMVPVMGGLRAAGTVELGGTQRPPNMARAARIASVAKSLLPELRAPSTQGMGYRPSMPDSMPVIGTSPSDARVIHAFGHGHLGLTMGAVTGCLVADLVSGHAPLIDVSPLRPDRFGIV